MAVNKRLLQGAAAAPGGLVPSEHFGVVLYEGDGSSSHSINGGKFGAGAFTDGSNSNLKYPEETFDINKSHTVSGWVNLSVLANEDMLFYNHDTNVRLNSNYSVKYRRNLVNTAYDIDSSTTLSTNTWYHIVFTFSKTNGMTLYINGSSEGTNSYTGDASVHSSDYGLMYRADNSSQRTKGKIDQVRIFTKALSSSEVSTLYAETAATVESLDPLSEDTTDTLQVLGDSSCVATYRFENNEDDLSGNYDGTGTEIQYAAGRYGQAASFNGSSSKIDLGTPLLPVSNFSVSMWFNTSSTTGTSVLFSQYVLASGSNGRFWCGLSGSNIVVDIEGTTLTFTSYTISTNTWYNFVLVKNSSSNNYEAFINGSSIGTVSSSKNISSTSDTLFGFREGGTSQYFNGKLDQVRIFTKVLSASEVTTLYQENSLVASYRFEGNANDDTRNYDGTASNVTYEYGLGFTPDFVWIKDRGADGYHAVHDSTRGATKGVFTNVTAAEYTGLVTSLDTGGFTVNHTKDGSNNNTTNRDGGDFVAWCLKANGGTTSSNTDGTNIDSTVQVNADAGFSIVEFTTPGTFNASNTVGHGLGVIPNLIIMKSTSTAGENWMVHTTDLGNGGYIRLNTTGASGTASNLFTGTTSTVFNPADTSAPNISYIAYCFANVDGFSKFGSYTGNGSDNGPIVETGFEPAFIMFKRSSSTGNWLIYDNKRSTTNTRNKLLFANDAAAEQTLAYVDFLSNGFQIAAAGGTGDTNINVNGSTYIYMAFAADPDTEAPTLASSFNIETYTGNSTSNRTIDTGFDANFIWIKKRNASESHVLVDSLRPGSELYSNATNAESYYADNPKYEKDSNGFIVGNTGGANASGNDYVAWAWKADDNEATIEEVTEDADAIAIYKFEDNANDVTGNHNGTASGVSYVSGKFNKAASFDNNINTKITIGTLSSVIPNYTTGVSFSFWVYLDSVDTGSNYDHWFVGQEDYGGSFNDGEFSVRLYGGKVYTDYAQSSSIYRQRTSTTVLSTGQWYHIVATYDTSNANITEVYLNGVLETTTNLTSGGTFTTTALMQNSSNMTIGGGGSSTDGEIDQFRIYDKVLDATSVLNLYNETASQNNTLNIGTKSIVSLQSIVSANSNAGFSIVKWEGAGGTSKIPHGLSAAPELIINKRLSGSNSWDFWVTGATAIGWDKFLGLNRTDAAANGFNNTPFGDTAPTSTVFTVNSDSGAGIGGSGDEFISYCFHSVSGYSKIGSYAGNGSTQSITTGFQPDFVIVKRSAGGTGNWNMFDSVRGEPMLRANTDDSEFTGLRLSFESNGFKMEDGDADRNASGSTYIYMAFKIN